MKTRLNFTSYFLDQNNPILHISARVSGFTSEILKPFKKLAVVYYQA